MRRFWPLLLFIIIFAVIALKPDSTAVDITKQQNDSPQRIITLAPSITETAFALGLGKKIVAVTDYCDYPAATQDLPKVGGFINPNLEAIVGLQPDLVILLAEHQKIVEQLHQLNIATFVVDNNTLAGIQHSIQQIAERTNHQAQAAQLLNIIQDKIDRIDNKTKGLAKPKVMLAMGHSIGDNQMSSVYIAGKNDFYDDLISLAGGQNAYQDKRLKVPTLSAEGILKLNPDIILDIFPEADDHDYDLESVKQQWRSLDLVNAVKNEKIYIIEQGYATIPGPRIFLLLEQMAKLIHPEINWEIEQP
ncbi:ABC transporter substrate-binding protein [Methylophaga sp. 42_25_T18]|nr:ABC transporter substrate-binding protein [Methylophaga sp. 42_25_T18]OUR88723.1 ABC transporter substrate-binding protein [Methylophaga sp. 42_8_T64]